VALTSLEEARGELEHSYIQTWSPSRCAGGQGSYTAGHSRECENSPC